MRQTLFSLVGICLFLAGCDDSTAPLSEPAKARPDNRLTGVWQKTDGGTTTYYLVGQLGGKAPEAVMRVVSVTRFEDGRLGEPDQFLLFPTDLGGKSYLNLGLVTHEQLAAIQETGWKPDLVASYFLLKYRVEGDAVLTWVMKPEAKQKAIEAGQIKGEIKEDNGKRIRFTDTTEKVAQFVGDKGDTLFMDTPLRFERVR